MEIVKTTKLSQQQIDDVQQLLKTVHHADQTYRSPYLSSQYNYLSEMPAFVLLYANHVLSGFSMLYADGELDEIVELYLNVLPQSRRNGYGTTLRLESEAILHQFGYQKFQYITEMNFLKSNPTFPEHVGLTAETDHEYQMRWQHPQYDLANRAAVKFQRLQQADIENIGELNALAFEMNIEEATRAITTAFHDDGTVCFVLKTLNDEDIGYCAVDNGTEYYLYNLFIKHEYRNQGYATYLVDLIVRELSKQIQKDFVIGVDQTNIPAVKAYTKAGFKIETEVVYLQ